MRIRPRDSSLQPAVLPGLFSCTEERGQIQQGFSGWLLTADGRGLTRMGGGDGWRVAVASQAGSAGVVKLGKKDSHPLIEFVLLCPELRSNDPESHRLFVVRDGFPADRGPILPAAFNKKMRVSR